MSESSAVIRHEEPAEPKGIAKLILHEQYRPRIEAFLPEGTVIERVVAAAHMAVKENPLIARCTHESIVQSISRIYAKGGEIGITSYLVPFKDGTNDDGSDRYVCTPIDDYKFLAQLMVATGAVRHVQADVVLEGEPFKLWKGTDPKILHEPATSKRVGRAITGAYVVLHLPFGRYLPEYMSIDEIEEIRAKSRSWSPKKIARCPAWYAKKCPMRRVAKTALTNPRLAKFFGDIVQRIEAEERIEFGEEVGVIEAGADAQGGGHRDRVEGLDEGSPTRDAAAGDDPPQQPLSEEEEDRLMRAEEQDWIIKEEGGR